MVLCVVQFMAVAKIPSLMETQTCLPLPLKFPTTN